MAPNLIGDSAMLASSAEPVQIISSPVSYPAYQRPIRKSVQKDENLSKYTIVWRNVLIFIGLHSGALYGLWLLISQFSIRMILYTYAYVIIAGWGITAGAHRLWAHKSYEAKLPLRILLMILQTTALQNDIYEWSRDHRVHHKFTETDADPHNARKGFFFSHMGWLMVKKHKDVLIKGKTVDMSDLRADPVVMFQKKYYVPAALLFCFVIPTLIPWYCWGESLWNSFFIGAMFRYTLSLHGTWLVNSAAHIFGSKPYDKTIKPTENRFVAWVALGEGWHNYHHVFPWDYKAAELGNYRLNITTAFLDLMTKIGWAYNLKTVSADMVKKRARRTGDGSWPEYTNTETKDDNSHGDHHHQHEKDMIWGWGDEDMKAEEVEEVRVFNNLVEK